MNVEAGEQASDATLTRVAPRWSTDRTERNLVATHERIARARRGARAVTLALGATALVAGIVALVSGLRARTPGASLAAGVVVPYVADPAPAPAPRLIRFPEGSTVSLLGARARARVARASREAIEVQLDDGAAAFAVTPSAARPFLVRVARVEMRISAARFEVAPQGDRVRVAVVDGSVQVAWPGGAAVVKAGTAAWFPPAPAADVSPAFTRRASAPSSTPPPALWAPAGSGAPDAEALMRSADAARRSGHAAQSLPYLRRLLRDQPGDVRAPLAAFTLGRILLAELGRPAEAADAFALARRLAPEGPLAPDALAREVEAAARGGDAARARLLAEEYVTRYPGGRRLAAVRRRGGLE